MKAILEFNLPEEKYEYESCTKANEMKSLIFDLDQEMRNKIKYGNINDYQRECYEFVRQFIRERCVNDCINLDG